MDSCPWLNDRHFLHFAYDSLQVLKESLCILTHLPPMAVFVEATCVSSCLKFEYSLRGLPLPFEGQSWAYRKTSEENSDGGAPADAFIFLNSSRSCMALSTSDFGASARTRASTCHRITMGPLGCFLSWSRIRFNRPPAHLDPRPWSPGPWGRLKQAK